MRIDGHDHYTGLWGSREAQSRYDQLMAEWLGNGRTLPPPPSQVMTIDRLITAFNIHAQAYYGSSAPGATVRTTEVANFRHAFGPLLTLYRTLPTDAFGPAQLKAVRFRMIEAKWVRNTINSRIKRIRHLFRWGVSESLVASHILESLQAVQALGRGRSEAVESDPITPAPEAHIARTAAKLGTEPRAVISMLLLTGARPGEIVTMTPALIDMAQDPWCYRPARHKCAHRGHIREIFLNAEAQAIVRSRLTLDPTAPVFRNRRSKAYTVGTLLTLINRAADRAEVPRWTLNQLRHNVATEIRRLLGPDVASALLGHKRLDTTAIYAEAPRQKAIAAVKMLRA